MDRRTFVAGGAVDVGTTVGPPALLARLFTTDETGDNFNRPVGERFVSFTWQARTSGLQVQDVLQLRGQQLVLGVDATQLPHRQRIILGDEVLDVSISAIRDRDGEYVSAMLCWNVATGQARLADSFEQEVGGVVKAVAAAARQVQEHRFGLVIGMVSGGDGTQLR
jgi:hypothetical protein